MDIRWILVIIAVTLLLCLLKKWHTSTYGYWDQRGIPSIPGALPIVGHILPILTFRKDIGALCNEIYFAHPNRSMVGFYQFHHPYLLVRDPEIVRHVLVGGFANFHLNVITLDPDLNPLVSRNPTFVTGDAWKTERSRLTVALMSTRKLKILFGAVINVCKKFEKYLEETVTKFGGCWEVDAKDVCSLFTGEVVASAGFGIEGDFFSNGSGPNSFKEAVTGLFDPTFARILNQNLLFFIPSLNRLFGTRFIPDATNRFLRRIVAEMIEIRRRDGVARSDFLQIMLDAQRSKGQEVDEDSVTASATSFFLDGYETSASTLGFFSYQVASHPLVQEKLRREVETVLEKHGGEMTYDAITDMTFMDQALTESMRLHPALYFLEKKCSDRCTIVGNDGIEAQIEPGTSIVIPIFGLHRDPKYWDEPDVYDPDRFAKIDKIGKNRQRPLLLAFGEGPRQCPGRRFGVHQVKAAMATMLQSYRIELSPRTRLPIKVMAMALLTAVDGGIWLKFTPLRSP